MSKISIVYGTTEGQTAKIADVMADVIRAHGHDVATVDVKHASDGLAAGYDGVILGASIHMGKHDKHAVEFVRHNREVLERVPSGFFSVSLAAHGDLNEAEGYLEQFEQEIPGYRERHQVAPGLTGLAQVNGGYAIEAELKLRYDLLYVYNCSLLLDLKIMLQTLVTMCRRTGQ